MQGKPGLNYVLQDQLFGDLSWDVKPDLSQ